MAATMKPTRKGDDCWPISLRLPTEYRERVDQHLERLKRASSGIDLSYSDVIRNLIALGLEAAEKPAR